MQTTARKGKNQNHANMFVLSPDQIKFNQGNLKERLDQEEQLHLEFQSVARRAHSNNPPAQHQNSNNKGLLSELEIQLQNQSEQTTAGAHLQGIGRFNGMQ